MLAHRAPPLPRPETDTPTMKRQIEKQCLASVRRLLTGLTILTSLLGAGTALADHHGRGADIVETARSADEFETLLAAASAAGLVEALGGDGPLTVFAPTDEAFGALPAGTVERLLEPANRDELAALLSYHVVAGRITSDALADGARLETLEGRALTFDAAEDGFTVRGARLLTTDVAAANGVIHIVDRVLMPPQRMSRRAARERIRDAVARGATHFNHGNAGATMRLYTATAQTLLDGASLSREDRTRLRDALAATHDGRSTRQGAWTLRYALDDVYASLAPAPRHDRMSRTVAAGG